MESILDKTENQLINLEKLMTDIEFSQIESKVVEGLQTGNEALKRLHNILSIDKIESILEETKEGIEKQKVYLKPNKQLFISCVLIGNRRLIARNECGNR